MAASQLKLDNLIAYLDFNKLQCDGVIEQTMSIEPIEARWLASRWDVQRIDGHDVAQLIAASARAQERAGKPHMIICDTVKGKGVAYMESQVAWHAQVFNEQTYQQARKDLAAAEVELWPSA